MFRKSFKLRVFSEPLSPHMIWEKILLKGMIALLTLTMTATLIPVMDGGIRAAENNEYFEFGGYYVIDGVSYYKINKIDDDTFATSQYEFLEKALKENICRLKPGVMRIEELKQNQWISCDSIAPAVLHDDTNNKMKQLVEVSRPYYNDLATNTTWGGGEYSIKGSDDAKKYEFIRSPRDRSMMAGSMKVAEENFIDWVESKGSIKRDQYQWLFADDTKQQPVFVTGFTTREKDDHWRARYSMAVFLSDFQITPLIPDSGVEGNYSITEKNVDEDSNEVASNVANMTGQSIRADQKIAKTTSATASSSINGSKTYGFEESISMGAGMDFKLCSASMTVSFSASQTVENGWSKDESCTDEEAQEHSVGIDLPPYTTVMMKQKRVDAEQTSSYKSPVAVSCRIRVFRFGTEEVSKPKMECIADIQSPKDLRQRALIDKGRGDIDKIDWDYLMDEDPVGKNVLPYAVDNIVNSRPMGQTNASFTETTKAVSSEVSAIKPTYVLSKIKTKDKIREYQMTVGDYAYADDIDLIGLNGLGGAYYGFDSDRGHWEIVNEKGEQTDDTTVASLETTTGGLTKLTANGPGKVYLKYYIDENCYDTASAPGKFKKNNDENDPLETAMVEINVSEKPFTGKVEVEGDFTGFVGDDFTSFTGDDGLTATVMEEDGTEIDRMVTWKAKEGVAKGIEVSGDKVRFTKEGTFHVCAMSGGQQSGWIEIKSVRKPVTAEFDFLDGSETVKIPAFRGDTVTPPDYPESCMTINGWYKDAFLTEPADVTEPLEDDALFYADTTRNHTIHDVAATAGTCMKKGTKEHYECSGCDRLFQDAEGKTEVTVDQIQTEYGDHNWDKGKVTKEATTGHTGSRTYKCTVPGCGKTKTEVIPKKPTPPVKPTTPVKPKKPKPPVKKPQSVSRTTVRNTITNTVDNPKYMDVCYDSVPGATGYDIAYKHKDSRKWVVKKVGKTTRARIKGFTVGGFYEIKVRARKAATSKYKAATGAWSPTIKRYFFTTQKIRLKSGSKGSFTMSWVTNPTATGYQVMFTDKSNGAGAAKNINTLGKTETSFTKKGLKSGKTYYVQVRTLKRIGSTTYVGNVSKPIAVKIR